MEKSQYTAKFFENGLPEWKRMKENFLCRRFYRPVSFYISAACARHGISANGVSYFSALIALASCALFLFGSYGCAIVAAIGINIWIILDCVDGNLARCVHKQPFGEFADGISSYILVAFMCIGMGFYVFRCGGVTVSAGCEWMLVLGAVASVSDTLMRLIYQKYKSSCVEMAREGILVQEDDKRTDHNQVRSLAVILEQYFGVGGYLPALILLGAIFNAMDLVVYYCFFYYGGSCGMMTLKYVRKAILFTGEYERTHQE